MSAQLNLNCQVTRKFEDDDLVAEINLLAVLMLQDLFDENEFKIELASSQYYIENVCWKHLDGTKANSQFVERVKITNPELFYWVRGYDMSSSLLPDELSKLKTYIMESVDV